MKKSTKTIQLEKAEDVKFISPVNSKKGAYTHKPCDHLHGRINRHAIGMNHEPGCF